MPGSVPATSQLDWLSSTTAMIVLFWSRATRDLLKSFGCGIAALHRLRQRRSCHPRRPPHSVYRSLSYYHYPNWLEDGAQSFVRKVSRDSCAPVKCPGGAVMLTLHFNGDQRHARTLHRNPT